MEMYKALQLLVENSSSLFLLSWDKERFLKRQQKAQTNHEGKHCSFDDGNMKISSTLKLSSTK